MRLLSIRKVGRAGVNDPDSASIFHLIEVHFGMEKIDDFLGIEKLENLYISETGVKETDPIIKELKSRGVKVKVE